ncbi:MAG: guanylate kinase [Actinobacteria bacterium]|jgi:guanylate kinase|nr:guanylate kinase [Actinomycetota bacterium]
MQPPKLSNRFRRKAGQKAVAARQERAKTKELIATGQIFFFELFSDERESISRMRLIDLLQSVPGVGKIRAEQILERTKISPSRRIGGVGPRQIELLREEFLLMKNSPRSGKLLVVSGPSGVGKSTITNQLRGDDRFWISVSVTTRKMRAGEVDGVNYHFVNDDVFDRMISNGEFLEFAEFAGAKYGTPRKPVESALASGKNVILEIELNGARQIRKNSKEAIMVFIEPPTWEELTARLINRGTESDLSAQARLERAKEELSAASEFDHVLVNHQVEQSVAELVSLALQ